MLSDYPIFEKWYSLLDWILDRVDSFPKSVRSTVSDKKKLMLSGLWWADCLKPDVTKRGVIC